MTGKIKLLSRLVCGLLCCLLIFAVSCTENQPEDPPVPEDPVTDPPQTEEPSGQVFTVAVYTGETIDPYTSKSIMNRNLISLCFDGLISLDSSYSASPLLAEYSFDDSGRVITFMLRENAVFSDGSAVTADDCVYSFTRAKKEDSVFASVLSSYVTSFRAVSSTEFEVRLSSDNQNHINLFTFPIVKKGEGDAVGSGRYKLSRDGDGKLFLQQCANPLYPETFGIETVQLSELDDVNSMYYNFNYGVLHAAYADLSEGVSHYKGNIELVSFPSSTFVFAVVNHKKDYLRSADVSRGISYCINRTKMGERLFDGVCDPVWQPFNPSWQRISVADLNRDIYSTVIANDYFSSAGYRISGTTRTWGGNQAALKIVCNNEDLTKVEAAKYMAEELNSMGFSAEVVQYSWENYKKTIASGDFDIYLGKVAVPSNMDISFMFTSQIVNSQHWVSSQFNEKLASFYRGEIDAREMSAAFSDEMPFIPLYYARGALAVNRLVSGSFSPSESNAFRGIENWTMR